MAPVVSVLSRITSVTLVGREGSGGFVELCRLFLPGGAIFVELCNLLLSSGDFIPRGL